MYKLCLYLFGPILFWFGLLKASIIHMTFNLATEYCRHKILSPISSKGMTSLMYLGLKYGTQYDF